MNKRDPEARAAWLKGRGLDLSAAIQSEDAFDAAATALGLAATVDELAAVPLVRDATVLREGCVWWPYG